MNITAPFKEDVFSILDHIDESAEKSESVNVIKNVNGKLTGYSVDYLGVTDSFLENNISLTAKKVLLLGAGGAAKAALYGLLKKGADVTISNRTASKAKIIAEKNNISYILFEDIISRIYDFDIIVSTLPAGAGMITGEMLRNKIVFDANYKHSEMLLNAEGYADVILRGEDWLINQAVPSFEILTGHKSYSSEIRNLIKNLDIKRNITRIALIGFMGSGKTTIAEELSILSGWKLIDIDLEISEITGMSTSDIFKDHGEDFFRKIETDILNRISSEERVIIATGGGIVIKEENRKILTEKMFNVWLYTDIEESLRRMDITDRPILNCENPLEKAKTVFQNRKYLYASVSDILILNENNIKRVAGRIYEEISPIIAN